MATPISPVRSGPEWARVTGRRYELDWLRAFVVLGLIPIHTAVIFSSTSDTYLKNSQTNQIMGLLVAFAGTWGMPLLFLVAGAGAYFALNHRSGSRYLKERALRLIVPFVFATLTIIPVQVYAMALDNPGLVHAYGVPIYDPNFMSSWLAFYVEYLRGYAYFVTHFSTTLVIIFWGHLWFIPRLVAYALVTLPLFFFFKSPRGRRALRSLGRLMRYPGAIYLFAAPLIITEMFVHATRLNELTAGWPLYDDWVLFSFYLLYFIYGYLMYAISTMPAAIRGHGWASLALGVAAIALALWLQQAGSLTASAPGYILGALVRGLVSWFWVVAVMSLALHVLTFTNQLLRYLNEAAFPIYVLHMPIVTIVGMYVIRLGVPWELKFVLIIAVALTLTLAVYELVVRRFRVTRVLFGVKPRQRALEAAPSEPWRDRWTWRAMRGSGGNRYAQ